MSKTSFRALCEKVIAYNEGIGEYNFSGLSPYDRDNAAFDAWQEIKAELKSALLNPAICDEPTDDQLLSEAAQALNCLSTPPWEFGAASLSADDILAVQRAAISADRAGRLPTFANNRVPMPTNADQAALMALLGEIWLRDNAPERLRQPAPASLKPGEAQQLAEELKHFLAGYKQMLGMDPEHIYSIHRGHEMEAHLTVSQLSRIAKLLLQYENLVQEVWGLVGESHGVIGLHLNGDAAPWDELLPGGRFERLTSMPALSENAK